ncbi:MAG: CoA transferase, partial [Actinomycetia bacterium]|nr:CoA transferase [Actinomycetes bacterium]
AVEERTIRWDSTGCIDLLRAAGVPVGPVHDLRQAVEHPVTVERGIVVDDGTGGLPSVRLPIGDAGSYRRPPRLGEHTAQVLAEAGFGPDEITTLADAGPGRTP